MILRRYRILIAEDELRIVSFLEKRLALCGFEPVAETQGDRILERLTQDDFDLLILDLGLPVKDGWQILEEMKESGANTPVIILSALEGVSDRLAREQYAVFDYIPKPFQFNVLLQSIQQCLSLGIR